jgi:hypothetical protein
MTQFSPVFCYLFPLRPQILSSVFWSTAKWNFACHIRRTEYAVRCCIPNTARSRHICVHISTVGILVPRLWTQQPQPGAQSTARLNTESRLRMSELYPSSPHVASCRGQGQPLPLPRYSHRKAGINVTQDKWQYSQESNWGHPECRWARLPFKPTFQFKDR